MIKFSKAERVASVICGILIFLLAAFFSTAIILNIVDYKPEGSLAFLWNLGSTLMGSYGFSSILIPGFLLVAGAFCFDSQWTVQRAMGLLVSVIPFFTIVGAEKIARKTVAFDTYTIMLVKLILLGVLTTLLVLSEYLVAMIIASAIMKKSAAQKSQESGQEKGESQEEDKRDGKKGITIFASIKNYFSRPKEKTEIEDLDLAIDEGIDERTEIQDFEDTEISQEDLDAENEDQEYQDDQEIQKTQVQNKAVNSSPSERTKTDTEFSEPKIAENFFDEEGEKTVQVPQSTDELLKDTDEMDAFGEKEKQTVGETLSGIWASTKNKFKDLMEFGKKREAEQEEERQRRKEEARRAKEAVDIDDYFEEAAPVLPKINPDEDKEKLYSDKRENLRQGAFENEHQRENDRSFIREETFNLDDDFSAEYRKESDTQSTHEEEGDVEDIIRQFETENRDFNESEMLFEEDFEEEDDYTAENEAFHNCKFPEEEVETEEVDIASFSDSSSKKDFSPQEDSIEFEEEPAIQDEEEEARPFHYSEEVERRHAKEEAEAIEKKRREMQKEAEAKKVLAERKLVEIESGSSQSSQSQYKPETEEVEEKPIQPEEKPNQPQEKIQRHGLFQKALSVTDTLDDDFEIEEETEPEDEYSDKGSIGDIQFEEEDEPSDYEAEEDYSEYEEEEPEDDDILPDLEEEYKPVYEEKPRRKIPSGPYQIPTSLLTAYEDNPYWVIDDETKAAALNLKSTLAEFKIEAEVTGIQKGPVVTMFEILPAPGVKLNRIVALQDNIALRLAASSVRIVAPIPGKHAVGIEVPNKDRAIISIRECLEQNRPEWTKMGVPVVLGKDIQGNTQIIDLVKTPHLLIAGATGAGKSVCVNSMIVSILYKRSPRDVKMILIDPKIVELKLYNDIPHLLTPVITEPKRAMQALQYCLCEMERRYALLDGMSVRDITSYNRKIVEKKIATEHLPYLIVVIDEFADLMATTGKQLEGVLARLAAMSRAVGIHLVLATQRPSIDVITGLIKANIPSRIAFMVASKTDSRIILDQMGADKLLGKGDMLYTSATDPFPIRIQGTFVSDGEVENVVEAVKEWGEPEYIDDEIFVDDDEDGDDDQMSLFNPENGDPLFEKALDIVVQAGKASASYIQRRLKIGYNRAARLVEEMEERGIVGPANGSKPREIIHMP